MSRAGVVVFVVVMLALGFALSAPYAARVVARQEAPQGANAVPLHVLATGEGAIPPGADLVWLVQRGALSGEQRAVLDPFPLGFALAQRGTLAVLDGSGTAIFEVAPGRAAPLPTGRMGAFASATGDLALYVRIALVPLSDVPPELPPETSISTAFRVSIDAPATLELVRGFLNPGHAAFVPAADSPALLLATDSPIQIEVAGRSAATLARDASALLVAATTIRNDGPHPASFVVARVAAQWAMTGSAATPHAAAPAAHPLDPVVDDAWRRNGCHLNPGNAACAMVGVAAACASDPMASACIADGDGDGCADVAEIRAAFDPFDPADCISGGHGAPAVNCLFPTGDLTCDGSLGAASEEACVAARDIRLRRTPTSVVGCAGGTPPPDACAIATRDPLCDGFAPYTRTPSRPERISA